MKNIYLVFCFWCTLSFSLQPAIAQQPVLADSTIERNFNNETPQDPKLDPGPAFEFSLKKDLPIVAGSAVLGITGLYLIAKTDPLTEEQVSMLNPDNISPFERGATRQYQQSDARLSDYMFVVSALAPFSVFASPDVRKEFTPVIVMYFETAVLTRGLTSITKGLVLRNRPFTYNPEVPLADKLTEDARHSFFSGHMSATTSFCFLTAYMVDRYAERPGWKWAAWAGAVVIPGSVGYWRYTSGNHFPSDILTGYLIGAGSGLLVPYLHRTELPENTALNIQALPNGIYMSYTF